VTSAATARGRALRILLAGPGMNFKYGGRYFYSFIRRLANGFVRNGHFVMQFSDRDEADYALGIRFIGGMMANRRLLEIAQDLRPDLICLQHTHLITPETVRAAKAKLPGCRVAVVYCDTPFFEKTAVRFRTALQGADFGFCTTGGETLQQFASICPVAFIPNPVDASIDNLDAFAVDDKTSDIFYASNKSGGAGRWLLIEELQKRLPNLRYALYGRAKQNGIWGDAYYQAMAGTKIGLNLNHAEGGLYASDRMAQFLGNGVLVATSRQSGYARHFTDDEMILFEDVDELAARIGEALADDVRWRRMAERGRSKARVIMNEVDVAKFIVSMTLDGIVPADWRFAEYIYHAPSAAGRGLTTEVS